MPEFWIQLENRPWDVSPNNIDRMTGQVIKDREPGMDPKTVTLTSPGTGHTRTVTMYRPFKKNPDGTVADALILRRYKPPQKPDKSDAWTVPDDRKINPWDINEPDPTDNGTMGTIPGPVIECKVGDSVIVHFRNLDNRTHIVIKNISIPLGPLGGTITIPVPVPEPIAVESRTHSLHPHGFVFEPKFDGAYPLSPPDTAQAITPAEAAAWMSVGVSGFKKGDRVPPGGTFDYTWNTFGWPTTAGVWLYHDHSICDHHNVNLGAIGIIVIHNTADPLDIIPPDLAQGLPPTSPIADLPGGSPIGSPIETICFPFPGPLVVNALPHELEGIGLMSTQPAMHRSDMASAEMAEVHTSKKTTTTKTSERNESKIGPPIEARSVRRGDMLLELDDDFKVFRRICFRHYRKPPTNAQYLQLFHSLGDAMTCINGRLYLGNTPTVLAGPKTLMRFGVVGMGNEFHTFHIHGHRWTIPGPDGVTGPPDTIQNSIQKKAVSQFEDTRTFGPANSFVFTIKENNGSFMGAFPGTAVGEWHMHCHVLSHMTTGMMGSLLIVNGGEFASALPKGVPCPEDSSHEGGMDGMNGGGGEKPKLTIVVKNFQFTPNNATVASGTEVTFDFQEANHTVVTSSHPNASDISINNGGGPGDAVPSGQQRKVTVTGSSGGQINYNCGIHGTSMAGIIHIS